MSTEHLMPDPRSIDPALRERYDVRGPRYTSYPAAPHFAPIALDELQERWRARNGLEPDPGLSLYFHIPFCRVRCLFCGCHSFGRAADDSVESYLDTLVAEMELAAAVVDPSRPVMQVAMGGGTPNYLDAGQLDRLLGAMETRWSIHTDAELSIELDPRAAEPEQLDMLLAHGFNRFSLGIQDFEDAVLEAVGRRPVPGRIEAVVEHLRGAGQERINFDLIYGLPRQDLASAERTAAAVVEQRPSRIALYSYAHVPWMKPAQKVLTKRGLPDPDLKAAIFLTMSERLVEAGYVPVGMDHFALPDDPLVVALQERTLRRTFMGYTTGRGLDNLGFGVSAISWVGSSYSQDEKDREPWEQRIAAGELPVLRGHLLSFDDELRRALLLELFCTFHVDLDALSAQFDTDCAAYFEPELRSLQPMVDDGLVEWDAHAIDLTRTGRFFVRNVCMVFDAYLERDASQRRYSRTV